jgi:hypothetical protein
MAVIRCISCGGIGSTRHPCKRCTNRGDTAAARNTMLHSHKDGRFSHADIMAWVCGGEPMPDHIHIHPYEGRHDPEETS